MLDSLVKIAPYVFYVSSLIFLILVMLHIKNLRQKQLADKIAYEEGLLDEKFKNYSDTDVLNALNELEKSSGKIQTGKISE